MQIVNELIIELAGLLFCNHNPAGEGSLCVAQGQDALRDAVFRAV